MPKLTEQFNQNRLRRRIHALGYNIIEDGLCNGISFMAMQAELVGEREVFLERLQDFCGMPLHDFAENFALSEQTEYLRNIVPNAPGYQYTHLNFRAFCEGVILNQDLKFAPQLFPKNTVLIQNTELSLPLTESQKLQAQGGAKEICSLTGIYTQTQLTEYFTSLSGILDTSTFNSSIILLSSKHAINISYDRTKKQWAFIDPNQLPVNYLSNNNISAKVFSSFSSTTNGYCAFSSKFYTTGNSFDIANNAFANWSECSRYKEIIATHRLSASDATRINWRDSQNTSWLYIAVQYRHLAIVQALLAAGAMPNLAATSDGVTPLLIAAQEGRLDIVQALLAAPGIDPNLARTSDGATPLLSAAYNGHFDVIQALLAAGALPNLARTSDGVTPLYVAADNGHFDVIQALLAAPGIDPNLARTSDGVTPLYVAAVMGHFKIAVLLIEHSATLDHLLTFKQTIEIYKAACVANKTLLLPQIKKYLMNKIITSWNLYSGACSGFRPPCFKELDSILSSIELAYKSDDRRTTQLELSLGETLRRIKKTTYNELSDERKQVFDQLYDKFKVFPLAVEVSRNSQDISNAALISLSAQTLFTALQPLQPIDKASYTTTQLQLSPSITCIN